MSKTDRLHVRVTNRYRTHVQKTLQQLGNAAVYKAVKGVRSIEDPMFREAKETTFRREIRCKNHREDREERLKRSHRSQRRLYGSGVEESRRIDSQPKN